MNRQETTEVLMKAAEAARYRAEGAGLLTLALPGPLLLDRRYDAAHAQLRALQVEAARASRALLEHLRMPVDFEAAYAAQQHTTGHLQTAA